MGYQDVDDAAWYTVVEVVGGSGNLLSIIGNVYDDNATGFAYVLIRVTIDGGTSFSLRFRQLGLYCGFSVPFAGLPYSTSLKVEGYGSADKSVRMYCSYTEV